MKGAKEMTLGIGDFNGHVGKKVDEFEGVHERNRIGEQNLKVECCWNSVIKRMCEK